MKTYQIVGDTLVVSEPVAALRDIAVASAFLYVAAKQWDVAVFEAWVAARDTHAVDPVGYVVGNLIEVKDNDHFNWVEREFVSMLVTDGVVTDRVLARDHNDCVFSWDNHRKITRLDTPAAPVDVYTVGEWVAVRDTTDYSRWYYRQFVRFDNGTVYANMPRESVYPWKYHRAVDDHDMESTEWRVSTMGYLA